MTDYNTYERIENYLPSIIALLPETERAKYVNELLPQRRKVPIEIISNTSFYLVTAQYLVENKDYEAAILQAQEGINLISEWDANFLKVDLHAVLSNAYRLKTKFKIIINITKEALKYADTHQQKIIIYELNSDSLKSINDLDGAYKKIKDLFDLIDFKFNYPEPNINNLDFIYDLPEVPKKKEWIHSLMRLVKSFGELCVFKCPEKLPSVALAEIGLVFQYGKSPLALSSCIDYALYLFLFLDELERGYKIAKQAVEIIQTEQDNLSTAAVLGIFFSLFLPWKESLAKSIIPLKEASRAGIEKGDFFSANIYALARIDHLTILGKSLEELERENFECLRTFRDMNLPYSCDNTNIYLQMIANLKGDSQHRTRLNGVHFNESDLESIQNPIHKYMFHLVKAFLAILFREPGKAIEAAQNAQKYSDSMLKYAVTAQLVFFRLLASLSCTKGQKAEIEDDLERLQKWSFDAPENFAHWYCLVQAEYLKEQKRNDEAKHYYLRSIALAEDQGRTQDVALSHELTGRFYLNLGEQELAKQHLTQAHAGFCRWGATAVAQRMEEEYTCLNHLNLSANFSQVVCDKILVESSEMLKRTIKRTVARLNYNQATQEIEVIVKQQSDAKMMRIYLPSLQKQSPEGTKVTLKIRPD